ncbi:MAG: DUF262 domain-containing protein [Candidatus Omnitrophota bacterium]
MKEYKRETIQKTVEEINKNMFLPDIQRPFVWEEEKIYKLFDSLMRGYPISTFLYWDLAREQIEASNIKMYKFVDSNDEDSAQVMNVDKDKYSLVLDGQQRLTSLYISLKGSWVEKVRKNTLIKELYFNVLSGGNENEEGILYEFCFLPKQYGPFYAEKKDEASGAKAWVNIKKVYEADLGKSDKRKLFVKKIIETNSDLKTYEDAIDDNIDKFDEVLKDQGMINYFPEDEDSYDKVLDIFVRTNAGGTKLSYSDLLFSRIKLHWDQAREEFKDLTDEINKRNFEFDTDFILKTGLVFFCTKTEEIRFNNINNLNKNLISSIRKNWLEIANAIKLTADLLDRFMIRDKKMLPSYNALIPVIYWVFKNKKGRYYDDNDADRNELTKVRIWLTKALLSGVFGGQSDTALYKCKEAMDASPLSSVFPAEKIQEKILEMKSKSMEIREDKFDQFRYQSKESHLFLSLCYRFAINFNPIMKGNLPEQDHIFSKHELELAGVSEDKINSIYNIRYVTQADNRKKSKTPFSDWVRDLEKNKDLVFKIHNIPDRDWKVVDFDVFLQERKKLLLANLQY